MKALFAFEGKFEYCDGKYYSHGLPASAWSERYLNIFDSIVVVGRSVKVKKINGKSLSSCERATFHCTEIGLNPIEFFTKRRELEHFIENEVKEVDFVIARLALSLFGAIAIKYAKKYKKPYICEVVGSASYLADVETINIADTSKQIASQIMMILEKEIANKGTIGIITGDVKSAREIEGEIAKICPQKVCLIEDAKSNAFAQIQVIPATLCKGLEFNTAIVVNNGNLFSSELGNNLLFIACTRAINKLYVLENGK